MPSRRNSKPPSDLPALHGRRSLPFDSGEHGEQTPRVEMSRHVTITWQVGSGGWFGRIVFGALAAVILIVGALVSLVVLALLALCILAVLAVFLWKARVGRGRSWRILQGKSSRRP